MSSPFVSPAAAAAAAQASANSRAVPPATIAAAQNAHTAESAAAENEAYNTGNHGGRPADGASDFNAPYRSSNPGRAAPGASEPDAPYTEGNFGGRAAPGASRPGAPYNPSGLGGRAMPGASEPGAPYEPSSQPRAVPRETIPLPTALAANNPYVVGSSKWWTFETAEREIGARANTVEHPLGKDTPGYFEEIAPTPVVGSHEYFGQIAEARSHEPTGDVARTVEPSHLTLLKEGMLPHFFEPNEDWAQMKTGSKEWKETTIYGLENPKTSKFEPYQVAGIMDIFASGRVEGIPARPGYVSMESLVPFKDTTDPSRLIIGGDHPTFKQQVGDFLEAQRASALFPGSRSALTSINSLNKWAEDLVGQGEEYHNLAEKSGLPWQANPLEYQEDLAVEFMKGAPTRSSEFFSPVSGQIGRLLPGGQGLQGYGWNVLEGKVNAPVSFAKALGMVNTAENRYGPYASLLPPVEHMGNPRYDAGQIDYSSIWGKLRAGQSVELPVFYVPHGNWAQTKLEDVKVSLADSGEISIYQKEGGHSVWELIGGGGRNAAQSGTFSFVAETPLVYNQWNNKQGVPDLMAEGLNYNDAARILANPTAFSRLGAEAYGGTVQPLDNRVLGDIRYEDVSNRAPWNMAAYVSPMAVNMGKARLPGANAPWEIAEDVPGFTQTTAAGLGGRLTVKPFAAQYLEGGHTMDYANLFNYRAEISGRELAAEGNTALHPVVQNGEFYEHYIAPPGHNGVDNTGLPSPFRPTLVSTPAPFVSRLPPEAGVAAAPFSFMPNGIKTPAGTLMRGFGEVGTFLSGLHTPIPTLMKGYEETTDYLKQYTSWIPSNQKMEEYASSPAFDIWSKSMINPLGMMERDISVANQVSGWNLPGPMGIAKSLAIGQAEGIREKPIEAGFWMAVGFAVPGVASKIGDLAAGSKTLEALQTIKYAPKEGGFLSKVLPEGRNLEIGKMLFGTIPSRAEVPVAARAEGALFASAETVAGIERTSGVSNLEARFAADQTEALWLKGSRNINPLLVTAEAVIGIAYTQSVIERTTTIPGSESPGITPHWPEWGTLNGKSPVNMGAMPTWDQMAKTAGGISAVEILPMVGGAYAGNLAWPKIFGYTQTRGATAVNLAPNDLPPGSPGYVEGGIGYHTQYPITRDTTHMVESFEKGTLIPSPDYMAGGGMGHNPVPYVPTRTYLPTDNPEGSYTWTAWEFNPFRKAGDVFEIQKGSSEIYGSAVAPDALGYFTKVSSGQNKFELFGWGVAGVNKPLIFRTEVPGGFIEVPSRVRGGGYPAINNWLREMGEPGSVYVQRMKGEYEGVIPQFTAGGSEQATLTATNMRYYTIVGKTNLPPATPTQDAIAGFNKVATVDNARTFLLDTLPEKVGGALYDLSGSMLESPNTVAGWGKGINTATLRVAHSDIDLQMMEKGRDIFFSAGEKIGSKVLGWGDALLAAPERIKGAGKAVNAFTLRMAHSDIDLQVMKAGGKFVDAIGEGMGNTALKWGDILSSAPRNINDFTLKMSRSDIDLQMMGKGRDLFFAAGEKMGAGVLNTGDAITGKIEEWVDLGRGDIAHLSSWVSSGYAKTGGGTWDLEVMKKTDTFLMETAPDYIGGKINRGVDIAWSIPSEVRNPEFPLNYIDIGRDQIHNTLISPVETAVKRIPQANDMFLTDARNSIYSLGETRVPIVEVRLGSKQLVPGNQWVRPEGTTRGLWQPDLPMWEQQPSVGGTQTTAEANKILSRLSGQDKFAMESLIKVTSGIKKLPQLPAGELDLSLVESIGPTYAKDVEGVLQNNNVIAFGSSTRTAYMSGDMIFARYGKYPGDVDMLSPDYMKVGSDVKNIFGAKGTSTVERARGGGVFGIKVGYAKDFSGFDVAEVGDIHPMEVGNQKNPFGANTNDFVTRNGISYEPLENQILRVAGSFTGEEKRGGEWVWGPREKRVAKDPISFYQDVRFKLENQAANAPPELINGIRDAMRDLRTHPKISAGLGKTKFEYGSGPDQFFAGMDMSQYYGRSQNTLINPTKLGIGMMGWNAFQNRGKIMNYAEKTGKNTLEDLSNYSMKTTRVATNNSFSLKSTEYFVGQSSGLGSSRGRSVRGDPGFGSSGGDSFISSIMGYSGFSGESRGGSSLGGSSFGGSSFGGSSKGGSSRGGSSGGSEGGSSLGESSFGKSYYSPALYSYVSLPHTPFVPTENPPPPPYIPKKKQYGKKHGARKYQDWFIWNPTASFESVFGGYKNNPEKIYNTVEETWSGQWPTESAMIHYPGLGKPKKHRGMPPGW